MNKRQTLCQPDVENVTYALLEQKWEEDMYRLTGRKFQKWTEWDLIHVLWTAKEINDYAWDEIVRLSEDEKKIIKAKECLKDKENVVKLNQMLNDLRKDHKHSYSRLLKEIKGMDSNMTKYQLATFLERQFWRDLNEKKIEVDQFLILDFFAVIHENREAMKKFIEEKLKSFDQEPNLEFEEYLKLINSYVLDPLLKTEILHSILLKKGYYDLEILAKDGVRVWGI